MVPRENENNPYAKFWGTNNEYYGIFRRGQFQEEEKTIPTEYRRIGSQKWAKQAKAVSYSPNKWPNNCPQQGPVSRKSRNFPGAFRVT